MLCSSLLTIVDLFNLPVWILLWSFLLDKKFMWPLGIMLVSPSVAYSRLALEVSDTFAHVL